MRRENGTFKPISLSQYAERLKVSHPGYIIKSYGDKTRGSKFYFSIVCDKKHEFQLRADQLGKASCRQCLADNSRKKTSDFSAELYRIYENKLVLSGEYKGVFVKSVFICDEGHEFIRTPDEILRRRPVCKICHPVRSSKMSLEWLKDIEKKFGFNIQHYGNGVEFKPLSNIHVDGYDRQHNIIFEYYGNYWHGHMGYWKSANWSSYPESEALTRLQKTVSRQKLIESLGFKVIHIWEWDHKNEDRYRAWLKQTAELISAETQGEIRHKASIYDLF